MYLPKAWLFVEQNIAWTILTLFCFPVCKKPHQDYQQPMKIKMYFLLIDLQNNLVAGNQSIQWIQVKRRPIKSSMLLCVSKMEQCPIRHT